MASFITVAESHTQQCNIVDFDLFYSDSLDD